jgi:hypothetical protein
VNQYSIFTGWSFINILTGTSLTGRTLINSQVTFNGSVQLTASQPVPIHVALQSAMFACVISQYVISVTQSKS